jgi:mevalonate kinase
VGTIIAVFAAYGLNVTPEQLAALNSLTVAVLGFLTYGNVSPVDTAISQSTTAQAATPVQTVPEAQPNP